jgi:hypothetical protein
MPHAAPVTKATCPCKSKFGKLVEFIITSLRRIFI